MIVICIILAFSLAANIVGGYVIHRGAKRLIEFDDLYELLVHDLDTNIKYLEKLLETPLLSNSSEIIEAQKNMRIIRDRLDEYVLRMEELARRKLRKQPAESNRPVVD